MTATADERNIKAALLNGLRLRCPKCGQGALFARYLKVNERCPVCGEALHHHRADDVPAYLTILIVAHVSCAALPLGYRYISHDTVTLAVTICSAATVLMLAMLPGMKGLIIGYQWSTRMYGFGVSSS